MKMKFAISALALIASPLFSIYAATTTTLDLNFEKILKAGEEFKGGKIIEIQNTGAFVNDKKKKSSYLDFNGRDEFLILDLSKDASTTFQNSFTLEFGLSASLMPKDMNYHNPGAYNIEVFSAFDEKNKMAMNLVINRFNRLTINWIAADGKNSAIQSSWNHKNNYELTNIQRRKWYHVALEYDKTKQTFTLFLDGEILGQTKIHAPLPNIAQLRFGGNPKGNRKGNFTGGIDDIRLSTGVLYDDKSNVAAQSASWKRLHQKANAKLAEFLKPENPMWNAHHPRMLLTPAGIDVMKANLKKGKGPELVKRLIAKADAMIDSTSPDYLKKLITGHDIARVMQPVELCLATILTDNKKYAEHAAKIVTAYTETLGYYDMTHQLVMSAGQAKPMMAVTLTYDWGYKYFTPEQRNKVRLFLLNIAKGTYTFYNGNIAFQAQGRALTGWVANWSALSMATLGNSSLAIMDETSAPVKLWLDYAAFRAAQYGLFATGMDGCFHEMPGYFAYGAGPIIMFTQSLHTAGGDDLIMATNFSKFPQFLPYVMYPYSRKIMPLKYSSAMNGLHAGDSYIMALLRSKIQTKQMEWDWQHLYGDTTWAESWSLFPLIWFKPEKEKLTSPDLPSAKWFKSEGLVTFRSDWTKDAVAGIFMAYPARMMAHDQCDRGQFTLYGFQGRWIIDNGGRQQPQFAWRDAHNLITIDGKIPFQKARLMHNYHHDSFMTDYCSDDRIMTAATADLTQSYRYTYTWGHEKRANTAKNEDPFKNANRKILYMREKHSPQYLLVYDTIQEDDKPHTYTLNLHTASENEVMVNKNQVLFHQYPIKSDKISYVSRPSNKDGSARFYYSGNPDAGYANYKIKVPADGEYDLYGFGRPGAKVPGGMDSFFINFGKRQIAWGTNGHPIYRWSKINSKPFELKAGEELLTVLIREPEARVAKFALYPTNAGIPLFDKPNNPKLIMVDAGKPDQIVNGFVIGKENTHLNIPAADMTLMQLMPTTGFTAKVFPGSVLPHQRLQTSLKAVRGQFLNFFYPNKDGMEQPIFKNISKNTHSITWKNCTDLISLNIAGKINFAEIDSDADLVLIRKQGDSLISFVMMNGSYLKFKYKELIKLTGGKGIAGWSGDTLTVSGQNVSNFTFNFPDNTKSIFNMDPSKSRLKNVTAHGKQINVEKTKNGWKAKMPFLGDKVLTW